jgi:hypothetical protein
VASVEKVGDVVALLGPIGGVAAGGAQVGMAKSGRDGVDCHAVLK